MGSIGSSTFLRPSAPLGTETQQASRCFLQRGPWSLGTPLIETFPKSPQNTCTGVATTSLPPIIFSETVLAVDAHTMQVFVFLKLGGLWVARLAVVLSIIDTHHARLGSSVNRQIHHESNTTRTQFMSVRNVKCSRASF